MTTLPSVAPARTAETGRSAPEGNALALYVHWPFCVSKCPYCDFNSHVRASIDEEMWREALLVDLGWEAERSGPVPVRSIFFGGGTPSLMAPSTVEALIDAAARLWPLARDVEITLEANPSSVEAARFADLATAGVNRVSLGLQSTDDRELRFLGRAHDAAEGLMALGTAQSVFERVSFDLIYALPGQSEAAWQERLEEALSFGTGHLSLYQLTIEPGTRFASMAARGELKEIDPDAAARLYEITDRMTAEAGLPAYEVSNHACPGEESRHNLAYWRYGDHAGIGPGAHGRRAGEFTRRHRKPENWLSSIRSHRHGIAEQRVISPGEKGLEALLMGLRLAEGVDLDRLRSLSGAEPVEGPAVDRLVAQGLLERSGPVLRTSRTGRLVLDSILAEIAPVPAA